MSRSNLSASRANLLVKIGSYVGDAVDNRYISDVGFRPDLLLLYHRTSLVAKLTRNSVEDTNACVYLQGGVASPPNLIKSFQESGFTVGTSAIVNQSGGVYDYIAIGDRQQACFVVGLFNGDGADAKLFSTGFRPEMVSLLREASTSAPRLFMPGMDAAACGAWANYTTANTVLTSIEDVGFKVRSLWNLDGGVYQYAAAKSCDGVFKFGTYVGTGASLSIRGLGFKPKAVMVKNRSEAESARILTAPMVNAAAPSIFINNAAATSSGITSLDNDGFTVGTEDSVNKAGVTYGYWALNEGVFSVPIPSRTAAVRSASGIRAPVAAVTLFILLETGAKMLLETGAGTIL